MNYEEFKKLAKKTTIPKHNSVYQVLGFLIDDIGLKRKSPYPKFNLNKVLIGFAESQKVGDAMIKTFISEYKDFVPYCFYIEKFPLGVPFNQFSTEDVFYRRLYDSNGICIEESVSSYNETDLNKDCGGFRGRLSDSLRFNEGDIVEVRYGKEVELGIIAGRVMTIERCWEIWKKNPKRYMLDSSDDQYTVYDVKGFHSHVSPLNIMQLRFPISNYLKKKLYNVYA